MQPKFKEPPAQAEYERLVAAGVEEGDAFFEVETARLRGMYQPPMSPEEVEWHRKNMPLYRGLSNDAFRSRAREHMKELAKEPEKMKLYLQRAKAAGVDVTGKSYYPAIATSMGDPDAWVGSYDDVRLMGKAKGYQVGKDDGDLKLGIPMPDVTRPLAEQVPTVQVKKGKDKRSKIIR